MSPKTLLIIAYLFPPIGGSGAIRPVQISKYLPENGWEPTVLSVKKSDFYYANDPGLMNDSKCRANVIRSFYFKAAWVYKLLNPLRIRSIDRQIRKYIFHPDEQIGWVPFAVAAAFRTIKKDNIQAIYSTSGPLSCHLVAYLVKKATGVPWIAEFRDEWFEDPGLCFPTGLHRKFHYFLEKLIVDSADRIVTMAPVFGKLLQKHTGNSHKIDTIPAGFDPTERVYQDRFRQNDGLDESFQLVFTGLYYESFKPVVLLKAIEALIKEGLVKRVHAKVQFVGANAPANLGVPDKLGIFSYAGFVSRHEVQAYLAQADACLLLLSRARGKDVLPSKLFEYMATGKPILAVVPEDGDAAKIIRSTETGLVADFESIDDVKGAYLKLYTQWRQNQSTLAVNRDEAEKYNQKHLFRQLAGILNDVCN